MNFSDVFEPQHYSRHPVDAEQLLRKSAYSVADLPALLAPEVGPYLARLAEKSQQLTRQRFGKNLTLFMPLYLSNLCTNICTYCGFSAEAKLKRTWLRPAQMQCEMESLKKIGVDHLLLVSGEAEHKIDLAYFKNALSMFRPHFANLQLESQPFSEEGYRELVQRGLDGVVVYQETYDRSIYEAVHLKGKKADFNWRLNTPDRIACAGVEKVGMGILLGLCDWRDNALMLAQHLTYMQKQHWRQRYSVSFPRLRPCATGSAVDYPVTDKQFIQLIMAFRLCFPDVEIVLSTRESAVLRDALLPLGITHLSAGSSTQPGGYAEDSKTALKQFDIDDDRNLAEMSDVISALNYQPVIADQIPAHKVIARESI